MWSDRARGRRRRTHLEHLSECGAIGHVLPDEDLFVSGERARVVAVGGVVQVLAGVQVEEVAEVVVHADRWPGQGGSSPPWGSKKPKYYIKTVTDKS